MKSKTTLAALIIVLSFLSGMFALYLKAVDFQTFITAELSILALVGSWGLWKAKDDTKQP